MWQVGRGKLRIKIDQCRNDTPESITELIRQCTEFDRDLRPNFAPEVKRLIFLSQNLNWLS